MQKERVFPRELVAGALEQVFLGMNILHESDVIHTDLHADNLLIALADDSILATVEQNEIDTPCARKQIGETFIYVSQYVLGGRGALVISDFAQARIGAKQHGNAMPVPYRAPEVILGMQWGPEAWDLLEKEKLFDVYDSESQEHNDACHLAAMTALLGPPPPAFLEKSPVTRKYWDDDAFCLLLAKGWWSLLRRAVYASYAGRIARVAAVAAAAGSRKAVIRYFLDRMFKYELTTTG
ncbi:hypothetical protein ARSEF1564_003657 [Beauveria bassiana]